MHLIFLAIRTVEMVCSSIGESLPALSRLPALAIAGEVLTICLFDTLEPGYTMVPWLDLSSEGYI